MNTVNQHTPMETLLGDLSSDDIQLRHDARAAIEKIGHPATAGLIALLSSGSSRTRLEAATTLAEMRDPDAAPAFFAAMEDENPGVRWVAAEGLLALGRPGLSTALEGLVSPSCSVWQREGAHHVLSSYRRVPVMAAVLRALDGIEPRFDAAIAARAALEELAREDRINQSAAPEKPRLRTH